MATLPPSMRPAHQHQHRRLTGPVHQHQHRSCSGGSVRSPKLVGCGEADEGEILGGSRQEGQKAHDEAKGSSEEVLGKDLRRRGSSSGETGCFIEFESGGWRAPSLIKRPLNSGRGVHSWHGRALFLFKTTLTWK
jgi:hypothetical protein